MRRFFGGGKWRPVSLALGLVMASGCGGTSVESVKTNTAGAPPATAAQPAVEPAKQAPAAPPTATPPTPPAVAAAEPARPDATAPATGAVPPASLAGKAGFDWLHPKKSKCKAFDDAMVKSLIDGKAECNARPAAEAFSEEAGPWHSCKLGDKEWTVFSTMEICKNMYEVMLANGP